MTVGFLLLCHHALDRAAAVARHLAGSGAPVVVHLDAKVPPARAEAFRRELSDLSTLRFCRRHSCEWGTWGLVAATQSAAEVLLDAFPGATRVFLASGACLPLRPVADLSGWLAGRPDTDFIESVTVADAGWTVGGLDAERFTLHFPVSWRRRRWLFDRLVAVQRRLGVSRPVPEGLEPHIGSQWWCLTRETLAAILSDPRREEFDRYFARTWIPDEGYFQTLARRHARRIESRSLTLTRFDFQGRPHLFHDDHLDLLHRSDCFMARKIWPGAEGLYRAFLRPDLPSRGGAEPDPGPVDRLFAAADLRRTKGRPGLVMQSRHPNPGWENGATAAPYVVLAGFDALFPGVEGWLGRAAQARVHGRLFAWDGAHFAGDEAVGPGGLPGAPAPRDRDPQAFLRNLVWSARAETQCFQFGPEDRQDVLPVIAGDPNARVLLLTGAWALRLYRSGRTAAAVRGEAARLRRTEAWQLDLLRGRSARAQVRVWTLAEGAAAPAELLRAALEAAGPRSAHRLVEAPRMADLTGLGGFVHDLRNHGLPLPATGDLAQAEADRPAAARRALPRLAG